MNEETLNNTASVCGNQHIGGFILLERSDNQLWRAYGWSAFFVRLLLSTRNCNSFVDNQGQALSELSEHSVMQLRDRLEVATEHTNDKIVFIVPASLTICESIYTRWKSNLPEEQKPQCNELQSTIPR